MTFAFHPERCRCSPLAKWWSSPRHCGRSSGGPKGWRIRIVMICWSSMTDLTFLFPEGRIHRDEFTWFHVTLCLKFHFQFPGWQKPWRSRAVSKIGHLSFDSLTLQGYWWLLHRVHFLGHLQQLHINSLQATMNLMWTSLRNQECPCYVGVVPPEWLPRMLLQHVEPGSLWGSG